jgi:hypothetical protein
MQKFVQHFLCFQYVFWEGESVITDQLVLAAVVITKSGGALTA